MSSKGRPRADARKRRRELADDEPKRRRVQDSASDERITLSLDDNIPGHTKGTAPRLPLVEEMFDINTILNDPTVQQAPDKELPTLSFNVEEEPVNMLRCADDDLSAHVPKQLRQKIWENKYINIALLLKGNAELAEIFSGGLLHVIDGKIEARPKQTKEKVNSIEQWTEAFLIFMSIYLSRYPDKTQELLKYITAIRDAAAKFPNYAWRQYDEQFRVRQALKVENWGKINADLWLRTMPVSSTTSLPSQFDVYQFSSCREFNNKGFCNFYRCRYQHSCDLCGSHFHGMIRCQAGKEIPASSRGFRGFRFNGYNRGFRSRGRGFPRRR